jgi:catechol 2,3-dioxygenase-like lactoylglutathione lyase family enzyme
MLQGLKGFQHVTISVSDINQSLAFYRDLLGFTVLGRLFYRNNMGLVIDFLDMGRSAILEIFSFSSPTKPSDWIPDDLQLGLRHFGFRVNNVDAVAARLKQAGVSFTLDPFDATGGVRIAFFKDPDGTLLEIVQGSLHYHKTITEIPGHDVEGNRLSFDHVTITVSDLDKALHFYHKLLGFPVLGQLFLKDEHDFTITCLQAGTAMIELFSFAQPTIPHPWKRDETVLGLKHLGFLVDNVDSVAGRLKAAGVCFIYQPADALGNVKTAFFKDPDGNALELIDGTCEYDM